MSALDRFAAIGSIGGWLTLNLALNFFNKWLMTNTGFKFPLFYTMFHMIAGFIGSGTLMYFAGVAEIRKEHLTKFGGPILLLSVFFVVNIATNNWSLLYIGLSINQIVKSALPLPTVAFSLAFEGKSYTRQEYATLAVILLGCVMAVWNNPQFHMGGFLLVLTSTIAVAAWTISTSLMLGEQAKESGLNAYNLTFYVSVPSFFILLAAFYFFEHARLVTWMASDTTGERFGKVIRYIMLGSSMAFAYNVFHFLLIKYTSSLTSVVMGNVKIIAVVLLSVMLMEQGKNVSFLNVLGFLVSGVGFAMYSSIKYRGAAAKEAGYEEVKGDDDIEDSPAINIRQGPGAK